jgi:hypothetical protein
MGFLILRNLGRSVGAFFRHPATTATALVTCLSAASAHVALVQAILDTASVVHLAPSITAGEGKLNAALGTIEAASGAVAAFGRSLASVAVSDTTLPPMPDSPGGGEVVPFPLPPSSGSSNSLPLKKVA